MQLKALVFIFLLITQTWFYHFCTIEVHFAVTCVVMTPLYLNLIRNTDLFLSCGVISCAIQRRKYLFVSAVIYFPRHLQKALLQIAFLIRIKEEVSLLGRECEEFAARAAICAESSARLILATAATRFTDLCGDSFLWIRDPRLKNNMLWLNLSCWQKRAHFFSQTNGPEALSLTSCFVWVLRRPGGWKMSHN